MPLAFPRPDMFGHGCPDPFDVCEPARAMGFPRAPAVAVAWEDLVVPAASCAFAVAERVTEWVAAGDAPVDALAMVRPRPRLAPRTPAAIAVPASGRETLI